MRNKKYYDRKWNFFKHLKNTRLFSSCLAVSLHQSEKSQRDGKSKSHQKSPWWRKTLLWSKAIPHCLCNFWYSWTGISLPSFSCWTYVCIHLKVSASVFTIYLDVSYEFILKRSIRLLHSRPLLLSGEISGAGSRSDIFVPYSRLHSTTAR